MASRKQKHGMYSASRVVKTPDSSSPSLKPHGLDAIKKVGRPYSVNAYVEMRGTYKQQDRPCRQSTMYGTHGAANPSFPLLIGRHHASQLHVHISFAAAATLHPRNLFFPRIMFIFRRDFASEQCNAPTPRAHTSQHYCLARWNALHM